jgi:hypothetical protein
MIRHAAKEFFAIPFLDALKGHDFSRAAAWLNTSLGLSR